MSRIVVVGGGQAGMQVAESLRRARFEGEIVLIAEEPWLPYQRPPLSKKFLLGEITAERLLFRPAEHYHKLNIDVRLGIAATALDRATKQLTLSNGEQLSYSRLALTTGARVRALPVPGADDPRVCYLRGLCDAALIHARLADAARIVVIGGGFIGLEVAAVARTLGKAVTVIEAQDRLMPRVVAPIVSAYYLTLHETRGVKVRQNQQVQRIESSAAALQVITTDETHAADLVIVGIGVMPNMELAALAGLTCAGGIVVDEFARTSDAEIVAAGDCTFHRNILLNTSQRLESVQNAVDQAKIAAGTLLDAPVAYAQLPWFWSDQYEVSLQMAGLSTGYDDVVVRGALEDGKFSVFYFAGERVVAVDSINRPAEHMAARRLLAAGGTVSRAQAADVAIDLKSLL